MARTQIRESQRNHHRAFTTLEFKINYLRPVINAPLEARARVVHGGKTIVYLECNVVALPEEKLIAKIQQHMPHPSRRASEGTMT